MHYHSARLRFAAASCMLSENTFGRIAVKAHFIRLYGQNKNAAIHASMMSAFLFWPTSTTCLHCYSVLVLSSLSLILVTGGTFLNVFKLSFMRIWPVFSLSYTVSLPFLTFCCQFVASKYPFSLSPSQRLRSTSSQYASAS